MARQHLRELEHSGPDRHHRVAGAQRLERVRDEVGDHLADLRGVALDARQALAQLVPDLHGIRRTVSHEMRELVDELRDVDVVGAQRVGARVREHLAREVRGALRGAQDPLEPLAQRGARGQIA